MDCCLEITDPAIDQQFRADNEGCFIGCKEYCGLGKFQWRAQTTDWHQLPDFTAQRFFRVTFQTKLAKGRCFGWTGAQSIDPDTPVFELAGQGPRQ